MTRDEQIADWIENIGGSFVMSDGKAVLLPRKACEMIALMLRNGHCRASDEPSYGFDRNASHNEGRYVCESESEFPIGSGMSAKSRRSTADPR